MTVLDDLAAATVLTTVLSSNFIENLTGGKRGSPLCGSYQQSVEL
jgi:hypothetical protein